MTLVLDSADIAKTISSTLLCPRKSPLWDSIDESTLWRSVVGIPFVREASTLAIVIGTSVAYPPAPVARTETRTAVSIWHLESRPDRGWPGRLMGAGEDDLVLDSPNWMKHRVSALAERGFQRVNDPRRQQRLAASV